MVLKVGLRFLALALDGDERGSMKCLGREVLDSGEECSAGSWLEVSCAHTGYDDDELHE